MNVGMTILVAMTIVLGVAGLAQAPTANVAVSDREDVVITWFSTNAADAIDVQLQLRVFRDLNSDGDFVDTNENALVFDVVAAVETCNVATLKDHFTCQLDETATTTQILVWRNNTVNHTVGNYTIRAQHRGAAGAALGEPLFAGVRITNDLATSAETAILSSQHISTNSNLSSHDVSMNGQHTSNTNLLSGQHLAHNVNFTGHNVTMVHDHDTLAMGGANPLDGEAFRALALFGLLALVVVLGISNQHPAMPIVSFFLAVGLFFLLISNWSEWFTNDTVADVLTVLSVAAMTIGPAQLLFTRRTAS